LATKPTAGHKYLETAIATASKEDLIIKIFDVLILASQQAVDKLKNEATDIEGIHKSLLRAQRACTLLIGSLDLELGGELAKNLLRVYEFWHHELVMANMQKDVVRVERILGFAKEYRETWMKAVALFKEQKKNGTAPASATAPVAANPKGTSSFAAVG
jgi:flagellar protein FliS